MLNIFVFNVEKLAFRIFEGKREMIEFCVLFEN